MSTRTRSRAAGRAARGVQLTVVPEPMGLRRALRALAEEHPRRAAELLVHPDEVADHVWRWWGRDLEDAGLPKETFHDAVAEYRRELWYWLWGNRTWDQCSQGLAGRLSRDVEPR